MASTLPAAAAPMSSAVLDERFKLCITNDTCALPGKLQLMGDMTEAFQSTVWQLQNSCYNRQYTGCTDAASADMQQWHKLHAQLGDIMHSIEVEQTAQHFDNFHGMPRPHDLPQKLEDIAPAAGTPNPYTDPDLEQRAQNKNGWWKGWGPPGEANPYHKW